MTFKKILLCLVCMFSCIISLVTTTQVRALDNQATPYANIERYTVKEDVGLNKNGINMGYVTCKVVVEYSSLGPGYTVISATCEPHFSIAYPFLTIGGVKSDPAVGKKITGDSVKVSFNVREMTSGTMWSYDCRIRI